MENALRANPLDIRGQYEKQIKLAPGGLWRSDAGLRARKNCSPCWARTRSDRDDPPGTQGRRDRRLDQSKQLCRWFEVPRRTFYQSKAPPKVQPRLPNHQGVIEDKPVLGYRTVGPTCWGSTKEHGAAGVPAARLAGQEAPSRVSTADRGAALQGISPTNAGRRIYAVLGGTRRLGHTGTGGRLLQPGVAGLACLSGGKSRTAESALEQALMRASAAWDA